MARDKYREAQTARMQAAWAEQRKKTKPKNELEAKVRTDMAQSFEETKAKATGWKPPRAGQKYDETPAGPAPRGTKTGDLARNVRATGRTRYVRAEDHNRAYGSTSNHSWRAGDNTKSQYSETPVGGPRPKKTTYGHGKDKSGKSLGITTIVDAGHNPSAAKQAIGANMARNRRPGTAPQAKAPKSPSIKPPQGDWGPNGPYRLPDYAKAPSKPVTPPLKDDRPPGWSPPNIAKLVAGGALAVGAAAAGATILKDQIAPKRNRSPQVEAARNRRPLTTQQKGLLNTTRAQAVRAGGARVEGELALTGELADPNAKPKKVKVQTWAERGIRGTTVDVSPGKVVKGLKKGKDGRYRPTKVVETTAPPKPKPVAKVETSRPRAVKLSILDELRLMINPEAMRERLAAERARQRHAPEPQADTEAAVPEKPGRVARARDAGRSALARTRQAAKDAGKAVARTTARVVDPVAAAEKEAAAKVETAKQAEQRVEKPAEADKPKTSQVAKQKKKTPKNPTLEAANKAAREADKVSLNIAAKNLEKQMDTSPEGKPQATPEVKAEPTAETTPAEVDNRTGDRRVESRRDLGKRPKQANVAPVGRPAAPARSSRRRQGSDPRGTGQTVTPPQPVAVEPDKRAAEEAKRIKREEAKTRRQIAREKRKQEKLLKEKGQKPQATVEDKFGATPAEVEAVAKSGQTTKPPTAAQKRANDKKVREAPAEVQDMVTEINQAEGRRTTSAEVEETARLAKEYEEERKINDQLKRNQAPTPGQTRSQLSAPKSKTAKSYWKRMKEKFEKFREGPQFVQPKLNEKGAFAGDIQAQTIKPGTPAQEEAAEREVEAKKKRAEEIRKAKQESKGWHTRAASLTDIRPLDPGLDRVGSLRPEADLASRTGYSEAELNDLITKIDPVTSGNNPQSSAENEEVELEKTKKALAAEKKKKEKIVKAQRKKLESEADKILKDADKGLFTAPDPLADATDTLTRDLARGDMRNVISSTLNNEGEFETRILSGEDLERTIEEARELERRKVDRRGEQTRRNMKERMTMAEVSPYLEALGEERPPAKKDTSRRTKKKGGDRRGSGFQDPNRIVTPVDLDIREADLNAREEWIPPEIGLERRQESWIEGLEPEDIEETKRRAAEGNKEAESLLKRFEREIRGRMKGRREGEANAPNKARSSLTRERELERIVEGKHGEPLALHARPGDYSVDTELADARQGLTELNPEKLAKSIAELEKLEQRGQLHTRYKGAESLQRLRALQAGERIPLKPLPSTRALPPQSDLIKEFTEGQKRLQGSLTIPDKERRGHKVAIEGGERYTQLRPGRTRRPDRRKGEGERGEQRTLEDRRKFTAELGGGRFKHSTLSRPQERNLLGEDRRVTEGTSERRTDQGNRREVERRLESEVPRSGVRTYERGAPEVEPPKLHERPASWTRAVKDWAGDVANSFNRYRGRAKSLKGPSLDLLGETGKAQGRPVVGTAKTVGKVGAGFGGASLLFAGLSGTEAGARELYEGRGSAEALGAAAGATVEAAPHTAKTLAEFAALDLAATKAIPHLAQEAVRTVGNEIARRTAQGTAGRSIANALLRGAGGAARMGIGGKVVTGGPVKALAGTLGRGGLVGLFLPGDIEAARTASQYMALPRQNKAAAVEAKRNKAEMERKYGTPERATASRKGWNPETGVPYTTDELYAMADEISGASAEWNKPEYKEKQAKDLAKDKRRKRITDTLGKYYEKYRDLTDIF